MDDHLLDRFRSLATLHRATLLALLLPVVLAPGLLLTPGCSSGSSGPAAANPASPPLLGEDCDPIDPGECGYPYPSNVWTVKDPKMTTGLHQFYGPTTLPAYEPDKHITATPWASKDGFSPGGAMMAFWPDVSVTGLPDPNHIDQSTVTTSPTIIMEYATGKLVPHWDEIDELPITHDGNRAFYLRPALRLKDASRYIVAIRHVKDSTGATIAPSPEFQALRDGSSSNDVSVGLRRSLYADILGKLKAHGVDPSDLQMAWDFTTASKDNTTADMISMRDQALAAVGSDGPKYTITKVTENPSPYIRRRIEGNMTVPLYLTTPASCTVNGVTEKGCPGSRINRDASGKPAQIGTNDYPFTVQIPNSVVNMGMTAPILQNAHGLFGSQRQGEGGFIDEICDRLHYIEIAVDLVGMDGEDGQWIPNALAGDLADFVELVDRLHQGFINELLSMRMMMGKMSTDPQTMPDGKPTIDTTRRYYRGDSQGGISGGVYMAISTDVERGLLDNTGAPYDLILDRSLDFQPFFLVVRGVYSDPAQLQLGLDLIQQLWDNAEPNGYLPYITDDLLPGCPKHNVIIQDALGDQQVSPLGAQFEARSIGARNLSTVNREVYGIPATAGGFSGNGYCEFNFWQPTDPITNIPPNAAQPDPHDALRELDSAQDMVDQFFKTGLINQTCAGGGPCAAPMDWPSAQLLTPATDIEAGTAPEGGSDAGVGDAGGG